MIYEKSPAVKLSLMYDVAEATSRNKVCGTRVVASIRKPQSRSGDLHPKAPNLYVLRSEGGKS